MGNIGFREGGSSPSAVGFEEGEQLNMEFAERGGHASFHTYRPIPSPSALISTSQVEHLNLFGYISSHFFRRVGMCKW